MDLKTFMRRVSPEPNSGCWLWTGATTRHGYGYFMRKPAGRPIVLIRAHRWMWEQHNQRAIPAGLVVMHSCDITGCVNPAHLSVGTQAQNMADREAKGRTFRLPEAERRTRHLETKRRSNQKYRAKLKEAR